MGGCFFGGNQEARCEKPQEYQVSRTIEPLQVPSDLDIAYGSDGGDEKHGACFRHRAY